MNILFLTLVRIKSLEDRGIYQDLLRTFEDKGHHIYVATAAERRMKEQTHMVESGKSQILNIKTLNIKKSNLLEKGVGTLLMEKQYLSAIKKHWNDVTFDLIIYSTPPITFTRVIQFIKNRDRAFSYLLLKDIFPQNAVDMGMMKKNGLLYKIFRKKEINLYSASDAIGCMSPANVHYLESHNDLANTEVEVSPNSIIPSIKNITLDQIEQIKLKYGLPLDKRILVYGGNLGKPQGVDFLLETIENCHYDDLFFLIVGNGTEFNKIHKWLSDKKPLNALLLKRLPKADYDELIAGCDIGLIFLSPKFSIPNFPSRLLPYLEMKIPVLAATDSVTDIGKILVEHNCGFSLQSGDHKAMSKVLEKISSMQSEHLTAMGNNALDLLYEKYTAESSYFGIMSTYNRLK